MRLALIVLVLVLVLVLVPCGCGGAAAPAALENRAAAVGPGCALPAELGLEARRYENLDADDPAYEAWTPWRVRVQLAGKRATLAMTGDRLAWRFDAAYTFDDARCTLELWTDTHEQLRVTIDLRARTGAIRSIDAIWRLGAPFPARRGA